MAMPKGLTKIKMIRREKNPENHYCKKCMAQRRGEMSLFKMWFDPEMVNEAMAEVLNKKDGYSGTFCVIKYCCPNFDVLIQ